MPIGYNAEGLISPLNDLLNDPKYAEICNGLQDKHKQLLNEIKTLKTQCLQDWQSNIHNSQRLKQMEDKINQFENLQSFKRGYQEELSKLFYVKFSQLLTQRLNHVSQQNQCTSNVYLPFNDDKRSDHDHESESEQKQQSVSRNVATNTIASNRNPTHSQFAPRMYLFPCCFLCLIVV